METTPAPDVEKDTPDDEKDAPDDGEDLQTLLTQPPTTEGLLGQLMRMVADLHRANLRMLRLTEMGIGALTYHQSHTIAYQSEQIELMAKDRLGVIEVMEELMIRAKQEGMIVKRHPTRVVRDKDGNPILKKVRTAIENHLLHKAAPKGLKAPLKTRRKAKAK